MSAELEKKLNDIGSWTFKGILSVAAGMTVFIFMDMRDNVRSELTRITDGMVDLRGDMKIQTKELKNVSDVVIRLDEKIERNKENIERLDRQKQDKR